MGEKYNSIQLYLTTTISEKNTSKLDLFLELPLLNTSSVSGTEDAKMKLNTH